MHNRYHRRAKFDADHIAVLDIETIAEKTEDGSFPPWCTHSPIVCSILTADRDAHGLWHFSLETINIDEDTQAIEAIEDLLAGKSLVTFNGRGFDLPVLLLAAQKLRYFAAPALLAAASEPRYESVLHYDLADRISGFGAARGASLELLCRELDIPAKLDTHGDEVADLYQQGRIDEIAAYCETDVAATLMLFAHRYACERSDEGYFGSLVFQFANWVRQTQDTHLQPFAEINELDVLLRCSLLGQIDAARANARANADWQEHRRIDAEFTSTTHY